MMARLYVKPHWRSFLEALGLRRPEDFLQIAGVIICGHPDRNVSRVTLGDGPDSVTVFLKKEHRIRWRDRLANAWASYGFCPRSWREMVACRRLRQAGIACPEVLAAGEHGGQAFALVRAVDKAVDLRSVLQQISRSERRHLAGALGKELARIHAAGFDQPDLYSKHVLVERSHEPGASATGAFCFLDWQRSREHRRIFWSVRRRDLAALDATLSEELVTDSERLLCLRSYVRAADRDGSCPAPTLAVLARRIRRSAKRLLRRRYVRELRHAPLRPAEQSLIWLDGEALCVTPEFHAEMGSPGWLDLLRGSLPPGADLDRQTIPLTNGRSAQLVRRRQSRFWRRLWHWLRRKRPTSPELEQAGTLFRLQRHGIATPRLLAFGQRDLGPWRAESFLLTETAPAQLALTDWLAKQHDPEPRRRLLCQAGVTLRRLHQAGYYLANTVDARRVFAVQIVEKGQPKLWLSSVEGLCRRRRARPSRALRDFRRLQACFATDYGLRTTDFEGDFSGHRLLP